MQCFSLFVSSATLSAAELFGQHSAIINNKLHGSLASRYPAGEIFLFLSPIVADIYVRRLCLFADLVCVTNYRMILCLECDARLFHKTRLTLLTRPPDNDILKQSPGIANQLTC